MTLIVSPGEDVLSSSSDDADSGCLAESPSDITDESRTVHDLILATKIKRLSLHDVKTLQQAPDAGKGVGLDEGVTPTFTNIADSESDNSSNKKIRINGDGKNISDLCDNVESKCDSKKLDDIEYVNNSSSPRPVLIYDCTVSVDSIPSACVNDDNPSNGENPIIPERKLEGPAVITTPVVQLASQVNLSQQKNVHMKTVCNNNNNSYCQEKSSGSSSMVSHDVTETLTPACPPTSEKRSENGVEVGGYSGSVAGSPKGDIEGKNVDIKFTENCHILSTQSTPLTNIIGNGENIREKSEFKSDGVTINGANDQSSSGKEVMVKNKAENEEYLINTPINHPSSDDLEGDVDIHQAKERINLLRQNFLSSLSAEEDDHPDFIVLPHHSESPVRDKEEEKREENNKKKERDLDLEENGKNNVDGIKVIGGSKCGSHVINGDDFAQEVGKEEEEVSAVPGGFSGSPNSKCQVIQSCRNFAFYDSEHLERDNTITTTHDNNSPLDVVPHVNVIPEEEEEEKEYAVEVEEDERVSSIKLLVSEASARLLEHELSGRLGASNHVSSDIQMCGSGNIIQKNDIPHETTLGGEIVDLPISSFEVNHNTSPPSELPPSPPPSPPPPPSSPQSPNLFSRDVSNASANFMNNQSTNFVNLMMLQSRKHKRLHRLRLPDCVSSVTDVQLGGGVGVEGTKEREGMKEADCSNDCEKRFQPLPPSAQPPLPHGNPHVQKQLPSSYCSSSVFSSATTTTVAAPNTHCGTTDQLCRLGPLPSPQSSSEYVASGSEYPRHQHSPLIDQNCVSHFLQVPIKNQNNRNQSPALRTTSYRKSEDKRNTSADSFDDEIEWKSTGASENDSVFENDSFCSDNSCLGYLNFDHESFVDSDNEYDIEQKNKLREACKDIARALNTLPSPLPEEPLVLTPPHHGPKPQFRDQEVEAHLSDGDDPLIVNTLSVQMRSCGTSTTSDDDRRNSFYDNNCGMDGGKCECGRCNTSDVDEPRSPFTHPPPPPPPPSTPPPPTPPERIMDKWKKPHREKESISYGSGKETSDYEIEDEGFRTDAGDGCRTDDFEVCTTSDDNDYDDDYCQTDDCGEECDYCSGDDAEDEAEDTCYFCKHSQNVTPVCKHPGVITNGILKSFNGRGREEKECGLRGVPHGRSLALQAAIHRRRLTRQGLVAIRESSITSDELPESEEEQSYDGSNCDISSSWRFGLCRDMTMSRDSTLRSVHSDRSSSSLPAEQIRLRYKEKSNSLPGANSRSLSGELPGRHAPGSGLHLRHMSASDDESGSHSSLPRLPPRPPRAPRMRPPLTPSPPAGGISISSASLNTPRPAMGLQGLQQQRSPGAIRALHISGLPVAPRTVAPRSPSNPNPPYGFPALGSGVTLLCPGSPGLASRSTPSPGAGSEGPPASPRINSRAGALVTRNFSISDDESGGRWSGGRRHVTITRHESVYKEVAEKGYHLPPGSPVDPYWLTWKLGVLQKTVEEVSGRLEEAQKTADGWGPVSHDPNLADQHAHNVRKFREGLAELQRGVDDVNDQAARFSAHNVPLTPANSAKLHDLNNRWKSLETAVNDRWRQVASRSREVTPLTPAQLASSVSPPWERATTSNKVPYYINHDQESTHWDHPLMMDLLDSMNEFNHIKFSAYRTATKLRMLQKKLALDLAKLQMATDIFDEHGLRGQNDRLIDVNDMIVVLSALYANISADHPEVNTTLAMDLCLNWLLNVYDSQRTGQMRVLSFKIGLVCLCFGHLEEKYRYMFRLIADPNRLVDQRKLGLLLHDCVQVPRQLGEVAAFGGSNIEPSVRSCFTKAGKDRETIEAVHFLTWVQQEPQSLVWLAVLHRVAASENIQHQVKCNICKAYPIVGLRYRCLKCLSFDMCQRCFFEGRSGKSHKITHPMHEYCTATTAGEDMKDFTKALKNKFKSKRSLQKHTKKGYLPVQTVLEGDPLESPSPSPQHNVTSQDMHSRLELYASRLAEVELRTNSNSTPDSEDEHGLIAQYCQSLSSSDAPLPVPRSPLQIMAAVDADQKDELEQMIRALEEENSVLQAEYDRLKSQQPVGSPPDDGLASQRSEADMLAEAKLLRQHKGRLEARMGILEEHNRQLEAQLHRLRQLLGEPGGVSSPNKSGTLQTKSVTASQLAMDSPAKVNGHSNQGGATSAYEGLEQMSEYVRPPPPPMGSVAHVGNLFSRAGDLGKAVGTLVATMTHEGASDLPSDEEDSNTTESEEEKAV